MPYLLVMITSLLLALTGYPVEQPGDVILENTAKPFQPGEKLTYKARYNLYLNVNVGKVDFKIKKHATRKNGSACHTITAKAKTFGFYDPFYKVRDHYETCLDFNTMLPNYFMRDVSEGGYTFQDKLQFHHQNQYLVNKKGQKLPIPPETQDLLSTLYYARTLDFEHASSGDSALINTFIDDTTYQVGLRYKGKQTLHTEFGKFQCLKIKPILVVGRIFDSKYDMTLWVTDDRNKIPVRIESGLSVGSVRADLVEYKNLKYPFMGGD